MLRVKGLWEEFTRPSREPPGDLIDDVNGFRHQLYAAGEVAKEKLTSSQEKVKHLL